MKGTADMRIDSSNKKPTAFNSPPYVNDNINNQARIETIKYVNFSEPPYSFMHDPEIMSFIKNVPVKAVDFTGNTSAFSPTIESRHLLRVGVKGPVKNLQKLNLANCKLLKLILAQVRDITIVLGQPLEIELNLGVKNVTFITENPDTFNRTKETINDHVLNNFFGENKFTGQLILGKNSVPVQTKQWS